MRVQNLTCCGWKELGDVRLVRSLNGMLKSLVSNNIIDKRKVYAGGLLFTQAGLRSKYASQLAEQITAAGLGEVQKLQRFKNPNTGRIIQPFMWMPDKDAVIKYCEDNQLLKKSYFSEDYW